MKILLYYDGTGYEEDALAAVKRHARGICADVEVVSTIPMVIDLQRDLITDMRDGLAYLKLELEKESIPCRTHFFVRGIYSGEEVIRFAREQGVDEIIINSERKARVKDIIQGSVLQHVILNADCPVTIV